MSAVPHRRPSSPDSRPPRRAALPALARAARRPRPPDDDALAAALARDLRGTIRGEVRFDRGSRALYATAASNYRQVPIGVVVPRSRDDVVRAVEVARAHGAPVLSRGGGTGLAGQTCNVAVVIDFSKYLRGILEIDPDGRTGRVEPGVPLDDLREAAERFGLTFGPDPATHKYCTLGGMIGNNSCGVHSVMAGRTVDNVVELEVLTYDGLRLRVGRTSDEDLGRLAAEGGRRGEIYRGLRDLRDRYADLIRARFPHLPRRVSGYNLDQLLPENGFDVARALVGTEGTCVTVLEATVRLVPSPPSRTLLVLGYPDVYTAADHVEEVVASGCIGCEAIDDVLVGYMKKIGLHADDLDLLPDGKGWLLVEFGGSSREESDDAARRLMDALRRGGAPPSMKLYDDPGETARVWEVRESGLGATAHVPHEPVTWEGWEDAAVPPARLGRYLREFRALLQKFGYACALYGHFGQGCVHTRIDFDLVTAEGVRTFSRFLDEASDLVCAHGGSLSGEHGDGQSKAKFLPKMFGPELVEAFGEFKRIWDPGNRMNPHKVVDPYDVTENLRLGTDYRPPEQPTYYQYPFDDGSFHRAALRCVGVGKCRQTDGFMCPSYHATLEEEHATRGRARLLWEMLNGELRDEGFRSAAVRDALDLCLSCKGCKAECPVKVDMATYKSEFMAQHYRGRLHPRAHYAFGLIGWWARLATLLPSVTNAVLRAPGLSRLAKAIADVAPERQLPAFAPLRFTTWFRRRERARAGDPRAADPGRPRVVLWPDVFNDCFYPATARAAVEALEALGYRVELPAFAVPAVRPMFDYGFLDLALRNLRRVLRGLRPVLDAGTPVVGLEPSTVAVYRDELGLLLPHDADAQRLQRQFLTFSEFVQRGGHRLPRVDRPAVLHVHCHHKAVMGPGDVRGVLDALGIDAREPEAGCCGMAGAFGFESRHYGVSQAIGERHLLPACRAADPGDLLVADGFSCRTQVYQATGRMPRHIAHVVNDALRGSPR